MLTGAVERLPPRSYGDRFAARPAPVAFSPCARSSQIPLRRTPWLATRDAVGDRLGSPVPVVEEPAADGSDHCARHTVGHPSVPLRDVGGELRSRRDLLGISPRVMWSSTFT